MCNEICYTYARFIRAERKRTDYRTLACAHALMRIIMFTVRDREKRNTKLAVGAAKSVTKTFAFVSWFTAEHVHTYGASIEQLYYMY